MSVARLIITLCKRVVMTRKLFFLRAWGVLKKNFKRRKVNAAGETAEGTTCPQRGREKN